MSRESLAARLRQAFLDDLDEQLGSLNADLLALEADPLDVGRLKPLFRAAHTLKGAARAASLPEIERFCHALEETLARSRDGELALGPGHFRLLFAAADALASAGRRLRGGGQVDAAALAPLTAALQFGDLPDLPGAPGRGASSSPSPAVPAARSGDPPPAVRAGEDEPAAPHPAPAPADARTGDSRLRVEAEKLDALLASVERLLLARAALEGRLADADALRDALARAERRARVRGAAADDGAAMAAREADRLASGLTRELRDLARVTDELADRARRMRMRPFSEACEALPRTVRDVAAQSGKEARLMVHGAAAEADRAVVDAVREALLHLVRNAVDHGLEAPEAREAAGKPRVGTITAAAALRGETFTVTLTDDGRGVDVDGVRELLRRRGLPVPDDDREAARFLFQAGVSTQAATTEISGRGVGLDAARAAVERVGGTIAVDWKRGGGTTFTLECPLTLATVRALVVRVNGHPIAIPTHGVEHLARPRAEELRRAEDREVMLTADGPVPIVPLARVLGPPLEERVVAGAFPAVRLRAGERRLAVAVDEPEGERELVVRPLRRGRSALPHLSGAALLGTGEVALVVNVASVVAAGLAAGAGAGLRVEASGEGAAKRRILVVDDSITTRTLEQSTLEAAGYEVFTAVDGDDGWRVLRERGAELVVTDVEMPGMDGIELCTAIRASKRFADLPVIVVSSLEDAEARARGMEAGADAYVGKSSFDQQGLLDTIARLLG